MADTPTVRLGRLPSIPDHRTLRLAQYLAPAALPEAPPAVDWTDGSGDWSMFLNDKFGCCTAASAGHLVKIWNDRVNRPSIVLDADVLATYEICTKEEGGQFDPATLANDNGCNMLHVVKHLRHWGIAQRKITAFASVAPFTPDLVKAAIWLFGGIYAGVSLPTAAQKQAYWDVPRGTLHGDDLPGSWGGHCIPIVSYDENSLTCITWGRKKRMSWHWFDSYCDEAYALLSPDWLDANGVAPSHFNTAELARDLQSITAKGTAA